jgi:hypothetical protein
MDSSGSEQDQTQQKVRNSSLERLRGWATENLSENGKSSDARGGKATFRASFSVLI